MPNGPTGNTGPWLASLDQLEAMGASVIVPGHRTEDAANDASGLEHTRKLLTTWRQALDETKTAEDLKAAMVAEMGELPGEFFLDVAVAAIHG